MLCTHTVAVCTVLRSSCARGLPLAFLHAWLGSCMCSASLHGLPALHAPGGGVGGDVLPACVKQCAMKPMIEAVVVQLHLPLLLCGMCFWAAVAKSLHDCALLHVHMPLQTGLPVTCNKGRERCCHSASSDSGAGMRGSRGFVLPGAGMRGSRCMYPSESTQPLATGSGHADATPHATGTCMQNVHHMHHAFHSIRP